MRVGKAWMDYWTLLGFGLITSLQFGLVGLTEVGSFYAGKPSP